MSLPSLNHFTNAVKACDPAYRRLYHRARGALTSLDVVAAAAAANAAAKAAAGAAAKAAAEEQAKRMATEEEEEEEEEAPGPVERVSGSVHATDC